MTTNDKTAEIRAAGEEWLQRLNAEISDVVAWAGAFPELWTAVQGKGHEISPRVMTFVEQWVQLLLQHRNAVFDAEDARQLVRSREIEKKKANSRFTNARVRDQWGGSSGMRPMVYRWPLVQSYVADMAKALKKRS